MTALSGLNVGTRGEPFDGDIVARIGKITASFSGAGRFMIVAIGSPCGVGNFVELSRERLIQGIVKSCQEPPFEFGFVELNIGHALAHINLGHGVSLMDRTTADIEACSALNDETVTEATVIWSLRPRR